MKRILSVILLSLTLCVVKAIAEVKTDTVTFTIDVVKGSNINNNSLKAAADSMLYGGISIKGTNASFGIRNSKTYRFYINGSTRFSALFGKITKVVLSFDSKYTADFKYNSVKCSDGIWQGEAQSVTLTNDKTARIEKIVVTYTPFDITLDGDGSSAKPFSVKDVIAVVGANTDSDVLDKTFVNVKGIVSSVKSTVDEITQQKTCYYSIVDNIGDDDSIVVKSGRYLNNEDFTSMDQLMKGDKVAICGRLSTSQDSQSGSNITELVGGNYITQFWGNELTIDELNDKNEIIGDMRHATVSLRRTFSSAAWNSLVLPFDMPAEQVKQVFGKKTQLANYVGTTANEDGTYTLNFNSTDTVKANTPLFVYGASKVDTTLVDVKVLKASPMLTPSDAAFAFIGSYDKISLQPNDWFISSDNKFYLASGRETMKATRAVFRPVKTGTVPQSLRSNLGERPTGVAIVNALGTLDSPIYNLAGQRVSGNYHGMVIIGGKKYVKK